jgi:hypothetical protein
MQKWDYLFVVADYERNFLVPRYENGLEIVNWKQGQNLYDYCRKKGKEGWEMVSASYHSVTSGSAVPRFVFKRPLE